MKNKFLESKKELLMVAAAVAMTFGGLPLLLQFFSVVSPNAAIISAMGVFFAHNKAIDSLVKKLINEQPVERTMKYEEKVKNYRVNQIREMIPFVLISLSFVAQGYIMSLSLTEITQYIIIGFGGAVLISFIPFVKALLKFIKGSE